MRSVFFVLCPQENELLVHDQDGHTSRAGLAQQAEHLQQVKARPMVRRYMIPPTVSTFPPLLHYGGLGNE